MKTLRKIRDKVLLPAEAKKRILDWQSTGRTVIFTNGCFDILHEGHVTYLADASDVGHKLVIGLNTDSSVRRQGKGEDRPINSENSRALILAALSFVDLVVFFDEDTPLELIRLLRPDVLVKGADYDPDEIDPLSRRYIVGSLEVKGYGGKVKAIPLVHGFSTTAILNQIKNNKTI
jgi:rfaE bifunctional protein nucleotidyltransferase chain/domain